MKNLFLLTISLSIFSIRSTQAQYFERSFQDGFYNVSTALRTADNGDFLFTVLNNEQLSLQRTILYRVDSQGQTIRFPIFSEGQTLDGDWIPLDDGYITTAYAFECDITLPRHLARYDAAGILVWEKELDLGGDPTDVPMKLLPGPDNTFWIFRDGYPPVQFSGAGDFIGTAGTALPLFAGYTLMNDGRLLTYGPTGLVVYSADLNSIQLGFPGQPIVKAHALADGRFLLLKPDKIVLASSAFGVVQEVGHGLTSIDLQTGLAVSDSSIWLLTRTVPKQLRRYDLALNLLETRTIPTTAPFQPRFIAVRPGQLTLLGEEYRLGRTQVVHLRATGNTPDFEARPDAALTGILVPHTPVDLSTVPWYHHILFDSVSVTLKNEGTDVLQRITINAVLGSDNFLCLVEDAYRRLFTNLQLAPGQSRTLYIGSINQTLNTFSPAVTSTELCFWTTLPNDSLDHNAANNNVCTTFPVIVAVEDPAAAAAMQIVPNPAHSACTLTWPGQSDQKALIQVINMAGQVVAETTITGNTWRFERNAWPAGMYQVLIINEKGKVFTGKVVFD